MNITAVKAVYYSATGNTEAVVTRIAKRIAERLGVSVESYDFTLPENRTQLQNFGPSELVVFGTPVYAGRVPNKMLPAVQTLFKGDGTLAVPVVTFGNRNFDSRCGLQPCFFRSDCSRKTRRRGLENSRRLCRPGS